MNERNLPQVNLWCKFHLPNGTIWVFLIFTANPSVFPKFLWILPIFLVSWFESLERMRRETSSHHSSFLGCKCWNTWSSVDAQLAYWIGRWLPRALRTHSMYWLVWQWKNSRVPRSMHDSTPYNNHNKKTHDNKTDYYSEDYNNSKNDNTAKELLWFMLRRLLRMHCRMW